MTARIVTHGTRQPLQRMMYAFPWHGKAMPINAGLVRGQLWERDIERSEQPMKMADHPALTKLWFEVLARDDERGMPLGASVDRTHAQGIIRAGVRVK